MGAEIIGISYRLRQLHQQLECARLTIENRDKHIARLQSDVREAIDIIEHQKTSIKQLKATQHHPGCGKYITHLKARLRKYENPPWKYGDE